MNKSSKSLPNLSEYGEDSLLYKRLKYPNDDFTTFTNEGLPAAEFSITEFNPNFAKFHVNQSKRMRNYFTNLQTLWRQRKKWRHLLSPTELMPELVVYVPVLLLSTTTLVNSSFQLDYPKIAILTNATLGCTGMISASYITEKWDNVSINYITDKPLMPARDSISILSLSTLFGVLVAGFSYSLGYQRLYNNSSLCAGILHIGLELALVAWNEREKEHGSVKPEQKMDIIPSPIDFQNRNSLFWRFKRMERKKRRREREEENTRQRQSWNNYLRDIDSITVKVRPAVFQWFGW